MGRELPKRSDVPLEEQWDAASIFPTSTAWEEAYTSVQNKVEALKKYDGRLSQGPSQLLEWLETMEKVFSDVYRVYIYASLFHHADTTDQTAAGRDDRSRTLFAMAIAAASFAEPEILGISPTQLSRWLSAVPELQRYEQYFANLERRRAHVRSSEVEEILGQVAEPFDAATTIHGVLADADLSFAPVRPTDGGDPLTVAQGTIDALLAHEDREVRRTAWESYADAHLSVQNTMASCLSTCVKQHAVLARARRHGSSLESALAEDNIPTAVFHAFIETFRKHLPVWHRYFALRREHLGYDKLHEYDLKAPLTSSQPVVPFDRALDWIAEGVAPLGPEYVKILRRGVLEERWVDARLNQGKRAGAFSTGSQGTNPFILMSYTDDVFSVSTLAHELGHSMHSYLTWQEQPFIYCDYSIFVAEVASNFQQALVRAHLLEQTRDDREFQIAVLEEALSNFHRYFFLMPTLARFELEIHQRAELGSALTAGSMNKLMCELFAEAYGGQVEMDADRIGITWAQFPTHLYSNFYVYQYGTGIAAAHALARNVKNQTPGAVNRYLMFLGSGASAYPIDLLKRAGVDLTQPEPVESAFAVLRGMVSRLEELL